MVCFLRLSRRSVAFRLFALCVFLGTPTLAFSSFDVGTRPIRARLSPPRVNDGNGATFSARLPPVVVPTVLSVSKGGGEDSSPSPSTKLRPALLAEAVGTFLIVHLGCGTVCAATYRAAQVGLWQVAAAWSLAVAVAIYCTAPLSGAHLNPAVTVAMTAVRGFPATRAAAYAVAQTLGAVAGAALNLALFRESIAGYETANGIVRGTLASVASAKGSFGDYFDGSWATPFLAETSGTFVLSLVVFSLTNPRRDDAGDVPVPFVVGATVGVLISVLAPLSGAGFNPARDLGPRLVTAVAGWGRTVSAKGLWVYVLGPVLGAVAGGFAADRLLWAEAETE